MKTITLNNGMECQVDDAEYDELSKYEWIWDSNPRGPAVTRMEPYLDDGGKYRFRQISMHRQILNSQRADKVSHKDGNRLNNQKENLKSIRTKPKNLIRKGKPRKAERKSKYNGLRWNTFRTTWEAWDTRTNKMIGRCATEENAAKEYDIHMLSAYADESVLNFPLETYKKLIDRRIGSGNDTLAIINLTCTRCGNEFPVTSFYRHPDNRARRDCWCKGCRAIYAKEQKKIQVARIRDEIIKIKSVPCADCHESHPHYVMQFHHLDPSKKSVDMAQCKSMKKLRAELEKCVIICANCHLEREWGEGGLSRMRFDKTYTV